MCTPRRRRPCATVSFPWRPGSFRRIVSGVSCRPASDVRRSSLGDHGTRTLSNVDPWLLAPGSRLLCCVSVWCLRRIRCFTVSRPPRSPVLPAVLPAESAPAGPFLPNSAQVCAVEKPMNPVFIGFFAAPGTGFIPGLSGGTRPARRARGALPVRGSVRGRLLALQSLEDEGAQLPDIDLQFVDGCTTSLLDGVKRRLRLVAPKSPRSVR